MSESPSQVQQELASHVSRMDEIISSLATKTFSADQRNSINRFIRDCEQLKTDLDNVDCPTTHDLVDFHHRRESLDVQYFQLTKYHD